MKQRIIIAKLAGKAATAVGSLFEKWKRLSTAPNDSIHNQMVVGIKTFIDAIRSDANPPVVFFMEYMDLWSMGDLFDRLLFPEKQGDCVRIQVDSIDVAYLPLSEGNSLCNMDTFLAREHAHYEMHSEDYCFVWAVRHASRVWESISGPSALIAARFIQGVTVTDHEIKASLHEVPKWLQPEKGTA